VSETSRRIRRALISVSDKTGLVALGRALVDHGVELISTGGSARALGKAGLAVTEISDFTGFPEIMDGRIKTLHPRVHAGILARAGVDDETAAEHDLPAIDLVVVNLYPFARTVNEPDCTLARAIEHIDIGGPALLRAAAKNHQRVTVLCDPDDYEQLAASLPLAPDLARRRALATQAFAHTAAYDGQISQWLSSVDDKSALPARLNLNLDRVQALRYGENPHQAAALYCERTTGLFGLAGTIPLQGKPLSFNNLLDADAAWSGVNALGEQPACIIVKHNNPCGAALGADAANAFERALACDPVSAYGGIIACNRPVDGQLAERIAARFFELVLAPDFDPRARQVLSGKPSLRLMAPQRAGVRATDVRPIDGGWLAQQPDSPAGHDGQWRVASRRAPGQDEWADLEFAWAIAARVRSNAIVLARQGATIGIGAGQMSRVDASRIAVMKARDQGLQLAGASLASDAFFPFADGIETAAAAGVRAVIQPGGSRRDAEVIDAADRHGIAMVLTGTRHFRH